MEENDFEKIPGTWSYELRQHFNVFSERCWKGFNACCEKMREGENMDWLKWREYVLYDMQKKHDEEMREIGKDQPLEKESLHEEQ